MYNYEKEVLLPCGKQNGSLYSLAASGGKRSEVIGPAHTASMKLWHERLCHVHSREISEMVRAGIVEGVEVSRGANESVCESCIDGKAHRSTIPKVGASPRSSSFLQVVHSNVCGPMQLESIGSSSFLIRLIEYVSN